MDFDIDINTQLGLLKFLRRGRRHGFNFACTWVRWMINESGRRRKKEIHLSDTSLKDEV